MTTETRPHFQSLGKTVCRASGKVRHRNQRAAQNALGAALRAADPLAEACPRRVYPCSFCGGWHLTSKEQR